MGSDRLSSARLFFLLAHLHVILSLQSDSCSVTFCTLLTSLLPSSVVPSSIPIPSSLSQA